MFVFGIMLSAAILMGIMTHLIIKFNLARVGQPNFIWVILIVATTSVLLGTALSALSGRKLLAPLTELSNAAKEVAKGNFDVRLTYDNHKVRQLGEMARNFNKMVQELSGIETLRSDFVVNVSHEFKTPIAAIEGYAALLQDKGLSEEEFHEYSRLIMESTKQLSSLSSNILKLSKLETQEITLDESEFHLDEQIRQALLLLEPLWSDKELNLEIQLDPIRYTGDEELLMQVWINLLGNAIKFTEREGEISVESTVTEEAITVTIADTGIGMTEEVCKRVFERFYQADGSRALEGNGLGLPLARRIVELCGGDIVVESEPGVGSVFTVRLPV
ncbi:HAMP domain-containing sensor histidine kinase [Gorillibacterium timonense]|uniref:HAMP domain-containing sensor histidine kinase n=1 Tax=Gorillibacterium timonense TaxID=1689269 RepID=UPI0018FE6B54|nr:HAMP domain-containing sensor histidine kinase [Gorillibacterium timonense]